MVTTLTDDNYYSYQVEPDEEFSVWLGEQVASGFNRNTWWSL